MTTSNPIPPNVMQTVETIPDEFMERAAALRSAVIWQSNAANEVIARALAAERDRERKRCIRIIEGHDVLNGDLDGPLNAIADAIRGPLSIIERTA